MVKTINLMVEDSVHAKLKNEKGILTWEEYFISPKLDEIAIKRKILGEKKL